MKSAKTLKILAILLALSCSVSQSKAQSVRLLTKSESSMTAAPQPGQTSPQNLRAFISPHEVDLSWDAPTANANTYVIERCDGTYDDCYRTGDFDELNADAPAADTSYPDKSVDPQTPYVYRVRIANVNDSTSSMFGVITTKITCLFLPVRGGCVNFGTTAESKKDNVNAFFQTSGSYSFLGQVKSTYNQASGSTTASADFASLNFGNGMQVTVTANAQAGSTPATPVSLGAVPTLSATGASQATQNLFYGGNFLVSELYPLFASGVSRLNSPGAFGVQVDFVAKEGTDIQNFKSGTNVNVFSPPFHGSAHVEGYLQYNSINLIPNSKNFVGALFLGGSYGYNYISHGYAKDYGFGRQFNNGIGQISFGIALNGVARITVSRGFGPSQTYFDSAVTKPTAPTTVDNFKAWSFGIVYQSKSQSPSK